jgi:hypothetical protein
MTMHCEKCLTGRSGDVVGDKCKTPGCDGIIEEVNYRDRVDTLPEPMTCGRRFDMYAGVMPVHQDREPGQDRWEKLKKNGDRVCSFCGSLHPDDFFALVKATADAGPEADYSSVPRIEPSDKSYKVYVHRPGVRNAMEGGIKFYMQHLPRTEDGKIAVTEAQQDEYKRAVKATTERFNRYLTTISPPTKGIQ